MENDKGKPRRPSLDIQKERIIDISINNNKQNEKEEKKKPCVHFE